MAGWCSLVSMLCVHSGDHSVATWTQFTFAFALHVIARATRQLSSANIQGRPTWPIYTAVVHENIKLCLNTEQIWVYGNKNY